MQETLAWRVLARPREHMRSSDVGRTRRQRRSSRSVAGGSASTAARSPGAPLSGVECERGARIAGKTRLVRDSRRSAASSAKLGAALGARRRRRGAALVDALAELLEHLGVE